MAYPEAVYIIDSVLSGLEPIKNTIESNSGKMDMQKTSLEALAVDMVAQDVCINGPAARIFRDPTLENYIFTSQAGAAFFKNMKALVIMMGMSPNRRDEALRKALGVSTGTLQSLLRSGSNIKKLSNPFFSELYNYAFGQEILYSVYNSGDVSGRSQKRVDIDNGSRYASSIQGDILIVRLMVSNRYSGSDSDYVNIGGAANALMPSFGNQYQPESSGFTDRVLIKRDWGSSGYAPLAWHYKDLKCHRCSSSTYANISYYQL